MTISPIIQGSTYMRRGTLCGLVLLIVLFLAGCGTAPPPGLTEFDMPSNQGSPQEIVLGPDGALWFTEHGSNQIGRITPNGSMRTFVLPDQADRPYGLVAGSDGALWFIGPDSQVGRITTGGDVQEFPIPLYETPSGVRISLVDLAAGADGALWLLDQGNCAIRRITTSGAVTAFGFADVGSPPCPSGLETLHDLEHIVAGPDGALWFTEPFNRKIGRISTNGVITEFPVPVEKGQPTGLIAAGPGGTVWFVTRGDHLEQITSSGIIKDFTLAPGQMPTSTAEEIPPPPSSDQPSGIQGLVAGPDGALWFTLASGHIGRMTLQGKVTFFQLPSGSDAYAITAGPGGTIWFTEPEHHKIGYITPGK
jgi:virginiamycin B lyase